MYAGVGVKLDRVWGEDTARGQEAYLDGRVSAIDDVIYFTGMHQFETCFARYFSLLIRHCWLDKFELISNLG
jgi:hypothetical protein